VTAIRTDGADGMGDLWTNTEHMFNKGQPDLRHTSAGGKPLALIQSSLKIVLR
jgi:hypothetical protein